MEFYATKLIQFIKTVSQPKFVYFPALDELAVKKISEKCFK